MHMFESEETFRKIPDLNQQDYFSSQASERDEDYCSPKFRMVKELKNSPSVNSPLNLNKIGSPNED